ncbi:hypothetical protein ACSBR2_023228 [Camellia fascicularis]
MILDHAISHCGNFYLTWGVGKQVSLREATEVYIVHWWQPFRPHSHSFESIYNIQRLAIWRYMEEAFFMDATKGDICSVSRRQ